MREGREGGKETRRRENKLGGRIKSGIIRKRARNGLSTNVN